MFKDKLPFHKTVAILGTLSIVYSIWLLAHGYLKLNFMVWNLFLAWIPLFIVILMTMIKAGSKNKSIWKYVLIFLWLCWLLYYPNSPYMITDYIHISKYDYIIHIRDPRARFNDDIAIWIYFFGISLGIWLGYATGFVSLLINQKVIAKKFNNYVGWIFVIIINFLSGFAIYLGRFNRWNSWDLAHPSRLLGIIEDSLRLEMLEFTILFGVLCSVIYIINYALVNLRRE